MCLASASVLDFISSLLKVWSDGGVSLGFWRAVVRPLIGVGVGLAWAWGIANMLGAFYWIWLVMMIIVVGCLGVMLLLSAFGFGTAVGGHTLTVVDCLGLALVLTAFVMLLSRPSVRAYRRHGRLSPRKPTEIATG